MAIPQSQTMPQLHYTRDDIREQYLGAVGLRDAKRAKSSDPKRRSRADESASEPDEEEEAEGSPGEGAGPRGRRRARKRRRRRANSASIFSACFQIPNLSSILTTSNSQNVGSSANSGQAKRSILAHLGIGARSPQRPISSSQTAGNLQRVADDDAEWAGPRDQNRVPMGSNGNRKHVSFLAGKQQQLKQICNDNNNADQQLQKNEIERTNKTVIMRGHQVVAEEEVDKDDEGK